MKHALLSTIFVLATTVPTWAVKTDRWEVNSSTAFMRGKLQRLAVTGAGELQLGYGHNRLGEFAKAIWCSVVAPDGTLYFGTGSPADVYAVGKDGKAVKILQTDAIAVTALVLDSQGNLYAATMAEGKIHKIDPRTKAADVKAGPEFCKLRAPYVWALIADKQDRLFAGTGPDGKIYSVAPDGKAEEWFAGQESNILSLAMDAEGAVLAGGSDRGLLYRVAAKGKGEVLHEFAEDEVKVIVVSGRDVFVAVNKQKVRRPRLPTTTRRPSAAEFEALGQQLTAQFGSRAAVDATQSQRETPPEVRLANLLAGALYLRTAEGRVDQWASWDNESVADMVVDGTGAVLVATAGNGRVYRIRDSEHWEMIFDFEEQQALTLALRDKKLAFVGTGNVGGGYSIDAQQAKEGDYVSEVRDCRFLTTWGNLLWEGAGAITVATRTGNTALPDATWSEWSAPAKASPAKIASPRGRYIQMRAQLANDGDPVVRKLTAYYQMQNQKPEISSLDVGERAKSVPEKPKTSTEPTTGTSTPSPTMTTTDTKSEPFRPKAASTQTKISWRATDKDGDTLAYRLYYQAEGDDLWIAFPLDKPLKKTDYTWDTESIPDGRYRIKVTASDEESNPAGEALTSEKISDVVKVDNRKPDVADLTYDAQATQLRGVARDKLSLIAFLEYSVDGGDWNYFAPKDGLFDDREESFEVKIDQLKAGAHSIAVRATDEDGNVAVEKIAVRVK